MVKLREGLNTYYTVLDQTGAETPHVKKARVDKWDIDNVPILLPLAWDRLWCQGASRSQLEIVVDNLTLADIANGTAALANERYLLPLDRIRCRLMLLFKHHFEYKGTFLEPVDWRPREHNKAADHVANCAMESRLDVDTLRLEELQDCLKNCFALQIFTDG